MMFSPNITADVIRPCITGIPRDNIANTAKNAFEKPGDIIPLWYGEGDVPTPPLDSA